jgi:hypothetical protein
MYPACNVVDSLELKSTAMHENGSHALPSCRSQISLMTEMSLSELTMLHIDCKRYLSPFHVEAYIEGSIMIMIAIEALDASECHIDPPL